MVSALFVTAGRLRAGWRFALFAVSAVVLLTAVTIALRQIPVIASVLEAEGPKRFTLPASLLLVTINLGITLALTAVAARLERRSLAAYGLPLRRAVAGQFGQGALWGLAMATAAVGAIWLLGGISVETPTLSPEVALYALGWAASFAVLALAEELLFRGYALSALGVAVGFWPAATILACTFGALHLLNDGENLVGAANVVMYALFAALTIRRTGNLWFAIGVHAAWDYALSVLYGVPTSGTHFDHAVLQAELHGPSWLTGGTVGPEGSIFGFAVLAVAFVVFAWRFRPAQ
jgi:membrane protease YdiL (CAAX protease family)